MITVGDRIKYPNYNDDAIKGMKLIAELNDDCLRVVMESVENKSYINNIIANAIRDLLSCRGKYVNMLWVVCRVIDEAYSRDLISAEETKVLFDIIN